MFDNLKKAFSNASTGFSEKDLNEKDIEDKFFYLFEGYRPMTMKRSIMEIKNGEIVYNWDLLYNKDHLINNYIKFKQICLKGFENLNKTDQITTIGIKPTNAHTGYGYIKTKHSSSILWEPSGNTLVLYYMSRFYIPIR